MKLESVQPNKNFSENNSIVIGPNKELLISSQTLPKYTRFH